MSELNILKSLLASARQKYKSYSRVSAQYAMEAHVPIMQSISETKCKEIY
jgi:hypothetical protein